MQVDEQAADRLGGAAGHGHQGAVEASIDVAVFQREGIALLKEEQHQVGMGDRISNRLTEIRDSFFGFGDLQRAITRHIGIQRLGSDRLDLRSTYAETPCSDWRASRAQQPGRAALSCSAWKPQI